MGKEILQKCGTLGMTTISVDFKESSNALVSVKLNQNKSLQDQIGKIREDLVKMTRCPFERSGVGLLMSAAGQFNTGKIESSDILEISNDLWKANVESALMASHLAAHLLTPRGLLVLTGAQAALSPLPDMVGYGLSKAATHYLVQTVAASEASRKGGWDVIGLLPEIINTPQNRQSMPDSSHEDWTELDDIAEICTNWFTDDASRPSSGSLIQVQTLDGLTTWTKVEQRPPHQVRILQKQR